MKPIFKKLYNVSLSSLKTMSNITKEEKTELFIGFIRYVFDEIQTEGWMTRKHELLFKYNFYFMKNEECLKQMDIMTFDKAMEKYGNMDDVISKFLCQVHCNYWLEAWILELHPELEYYVDDYAEDGELWDDFDKFLYKPSDGVSSAYMKGIDYDKIKEILGLFLEPK